jgi:urea carboxylase
MAAKFDTLLVANRGEIACRIIRTATRMGLNTVAVYSDADRGAAHVAIADAAVRLGPPAARESYLLGDRVIRAALATGAGAIHPGYGLLSENAGFARAVERAGLAWVGPTPAQIDLFGDKHRARALAESAGVPLLSGSGLLSSAAAADAAAERIGFPVMLKATAGGGGIGMERCDDADQVADAFGRIERLAEASFGGGGIFLERCIGQARHVEVQVFGDGDGRVIALGDRDCSIQRRNQKVIEEAPAPGLSEELREMLAGSAVKLCESADYRSAGTVEFVVDGTRGDASFLEVNTRLQVEHPVTEQIYGIDLVEWMLRVAQNDTSMFDEPLPAPKGYSIEARVYAEDPAAGHRPSPGLLTEVKLPDSIRVDHWIERGTEVSTAYDPMLAKLIATGETRDDAIETLLAALGETRIGGIATNIGLLRGALTNDSFRAANHTTSTLARITDADRRIDVIKAGTMTAVQDWPGRIGFWQVGVPPSGPMDDRSLRAGNIALGNPEGAAGLECTLDGPSLRFNWPATVMICGGECEPHVDGSRVPLWQPVELAAGSLLEVGALKGLGLRAYVLVRGGIDVPSYLGSAATFALGGFGGHAGRALRPGDVLHPGDAAANSDPVEVALADRSPLANNWKIAVTEGPHAAPEFFTAEDIKSFYAADWEVHFNSARTGVRLVGPRPRWARQDGGEAGLHPSNIHDTPYSVGAVDFTGDVPILLGPDGPSLGGFVCPATVVTAERWKLGQLRPGDTVRFVAISERSAIEMRNERRTSIAPLASGERDNGILGRREASDAAPAVTYRRSGDDNLLIEYGEMKLDLGLRMRVHALAERFAAEDARGMVDITPGIRSLQLHFDPDKLGLRSALSLAQSIEDELPPTEALEVPSRIVNLPLSWDDPATREAIDRYMAGVRSDAPWCPWNIEFIRRINGLGSVEDVHRIVHDADYLVLGLGDVYLGAPVATPLDPRHRLVTTKYNPARTWTAENSVGIGGAYLCIYGMEGPGGYQFVGRTTQVWNPYRSNDLFEPDSPWLLRFFDRIRWHSVSAEELLDERAAMAAGRLHIDIDTGTFSMADYTKYLSENAASIDEFKQTQTAAFSAERRAWAAAGEFDPRPEPVSAGPNGRVPIDVPPGAALVEAPISASVWQINVAPGDSIAEGGRLLTLEAMKTETSLESPIDGKVLDILVGVGDQVDSGSPMVLVGPG